MNMLSYGYDILGSHVQYILVHALFEHFYDSIALKSYTNILSFMYAQVHYHNDKHTMIYYEFFYLHKSFMLMLLNFYEECLSGVCVHISYFNFRNDIKPLSHKAK